MIFRLNFFKIIIVIFIIFGYLQAQEEKRLYGNIYFDITAMSGTNKTIMSYRDFKIEILEVPKKVSKNKEDQKVLFTTYPDSNGYFTFKDVPAGKYMLRILYISIDKDGFIKTGFIYEEILSKKIEVDYNGRERQRLKPISIEIIIKDREDMDR
jgi:hypothetical protein